MQNCTSGRTWLHKLQKIQHISESPSLSEMFFPPTFQLPILVTSTQNMLSDNQPILSSILVLTLPSTFLLCTLGQLTLFMNRIFLHVYIFSLNTFHRQLDSLPAGCQFFVPLSHLFLFIKPTSPPLSRVKISQDFWKLFRKGSSTAMHRFHQICPIVATQCFWHQQMICRVDINKAMYVTTHPVTFDTA